MEMYIRDYQVIKMNKISSKELVVFVLYLSVFLFPGFGDTIILATSKNTSIITSIIGFILGLIPLFLILYISKFCIDKNIFQINVEKFKFFGYILNIFLIISVIYIIMMGSWSIINFTISQFLTRTSYYFLTIIMFSLVAFCVIKGLEVTARTSIALTITFIIITLFGWLLLIPSVEIENIYPIFDISKKTFLSSLTIPLTFAVFPLIGLLFIKKNDVKNNKHFNRNIILGYIGSGILITIFLFFIISIFGIDLASLFTYPEYNVFKKVKAFDFLERIENIIAVIIFISSFCSCSILFLFIKEYLKTTFKIKKEKVTNIIIIILCLFIPFSIIYIFKNYYLYFLFTKYATISYFILIIIIINALLLFFTTLRKKRS